MNPMIDVATLLISLTAVELIMSMVLLLFTAVGQKVKGVVELAIGLMIGSVGSILAFVAASPPANRYYLFAASICFVVGIIMTARAMRSLQKYAPRKVLEACCLAIAVIFNGWFILAEFYVVGMFVVNSALFAVITTLTALDLLREKRLDLKPGCRILGIIFCLFAGFMAFRALIRPFVENGIGPLPQVALIDGVAALVAIVAALLWAVAYLWAVYGASEYRLKRANADLERFTGAVAHDLKAPLNSIIGFLGILKQAGADVAPQKSEEYIASASQAAWQMNEIIDELLDQATHANDEQKFDVVDTNLCSQKAANNLAFQFMSSGCRVSASQLPSVWGNQTQLIRLFQNLYDNAIKYRDSDREPSIIVTTTPQDDMVLFSVSDNGIGVPDDANDYIFDYMHRVGDAKRTVGTGVGLSECRRIVDVHGGSLWVDGVPGQGSTFQFTLKHAQQKK